MKTIDQLEKETKRLCTSRGHKMGRFVRLHYGWSQKSERIEASSTCENCRMEVFITTSPYPNEIDISGQAIGLTCPGNNPIPPMKKPKITIEKSPNAPCCFLIQQVGTNKSILIQSDWDCPGIAQLFGWVPCSICDYTDGTIDCEHKKASDMIAEAKEVILENLSVETEDPGYF